MLRSGEQELKCKKESDAAEEGLSNTVKCCYSRSLTEVGFKQLLPPLRFRKYDAQPYREHSSAEAGAPLLKDHEEEILLPSDRHVLCQKEGSGSQMKRVNRFEFVSFAFHF
ncbi:hypothetical protein HPP92_005628 [Vanilla planifolia]|uniref:Uncharacterized protein n=1 Tax=Vanilla planifolia TaxID=51239 RepID=A0A835VBJ3_VANPL|nr:hypothetical protein HPP92_005628 [Vanilla planifolia]